MRRAPHQRKNGKSRDPAGMTSLQKRTQEADDEEKHSSEAALKALDAIKKN